MIFRKDTVLNQCSKCELGQCKAGDSRGGNAGLFAFVDFVGIEIGVRISHKRASARTTAYFAQIERPNSGGKGGGPFRHAAPLAERRSGAGLVTMFSDGPGGSIR